MFTIFGVIHHKAPAGFAGLAIGLVVFAAIIPVAPDHRRLDQPGPHLRPDARAAGRRRHRPVGAAARLPGSRAPGRHRRRARLRRTGEGRRPVDVPERARRRALRPRLTRRPNHRSRRNHCHEEAHQRSSSRTAPRGCAASGRRTPTSPGQPLGAVIIRATRPRAGKVTLVRAAAPDEPLHAGFVGLRHARRGLPPARCSPLPRRTLSLAATGVNAGAGVVHIVKNYTGDVMNFQIAAELAADERHPRRNVLVDDDVAVEDSLYTAGRRGTGVTVLVEKIAGACGRPGPVACWPMWSAPRAARWSPPESQLRGGAVLVHDASSRPI